MCMMKSYPKVHLEEEEQQQEEEEEKRTAAQLTSGGGGGGFHLWVWLANAMTTAAWLPGTREKQKPGKICIVKGGSWTHITSLWWL